MTMADDEYRIADRLGRALEAEARHDPLPFDFVAEITNELGDRRSRGFSWFAGLPAVAATIVLAIVAVAVPLALSRPSTTPGAPSASSAPSSSTASAACAITRPTPLLTAPAPYPSSPPRGGAAWYGTPQLWTMLELEGEVWNLPALGEKTWWWSADWQPADEPEPAIVVTGTRLDGPGTFTAGPGTNANSADLGGWAMLVGVEFPSAGCWQLTAEYRDAVLSYVVQVAQTPHASQSGLTEDEAVAAARRAADRPDATAVATDSGPADEVLPSVGVEWAHVPSADTWVWSVKLSDGGPPLGQEGSWVVLDYFDATIYGIQDWRS